MMRGIFRPSACTWPWLVAVGAALICAELTLRARAAATTLRADWPREVDELYLPPASLLRRASLGHTQLMADLIAARTNVYFGEQIATSAEQKWLHYYINTVIDLDPTFEPIYLRGAAMLIYGTPGGASLDGFLKVDAILARGLKQFPGNWEIWFQRGFNLAFELTRFVPKNSPRYREWRREGTLALQRSTLFSGIPPHLPNLVAGMLTEQGERELAIQHLERIYAITSDPKAREQIVGKLRQLMGEAFRLTFDEEAARLERLVQERYPYAPEAFSIIAGPRAHPRVAPQ